MISWNKKYNNIIAKLITLFLLFKNGWFQPDIKNVFLIIIEIYHIFKQILKINVDKPEVTRITKLKIKQLKRFIFMN